MPFNENSKDNEKYKFYDNGLNEATVRVGGTGSIISGLQFDEIQATYPNNTTEIYQYILDSELIATVTITYTNSSKDEVVSVIRT